MVFEVTKVRIAGDGELQGPCVMDSYHNLPDKTAETLTEDGWLRTGDKGQVDGKGFLTITGRIKELFRTSGGKSLRRRRSRQVHGALSVCEPHPCLW